MGEPIIEELVRSVQDEFPDFSEAEKQGVKELDATLKAAISKVNKSAKKVRKAADKIDKVWRDCRIAHVSGTSAAIFGTILTIFGGIATIATAGAATPLMLVGMGFGAAGTVTNLGTSIVEACINSSEITEADEQLKTAFTSIKKVRQKVREILYKKDIGRSVEIFGFAVYALELSESIIKILQDLASRSLNISGDVMELASQSAKQIGKTAADDGGEAAAKQAAAAAAAKAAAKRAGVVIIGLSVFFLAVDLIDLGFTIRDLVKNEGLESAKTLRQIADELEKACRKKKI